jgi:hypothetical protein
MGLHGMLGDSFSFLYLDDVHISYEIHLRASAACNRRRFKFLYVDDVRTSWETHLWVLLQE